MASVVKGARPLGSTDGCGLGVELGAGVVLRVGDTMDEPQEHLAWRRQLYCRSCHGYFLETHGTLLHGKSLSVGLVVRVLACLAEGLGIRATARGLKSTPTPCCNGWWKLPSNPGLLAIRDRQSCMRSSKPHARVHDRLMVTSSGGLGRCRDISRTQQVRDPA